MATKTKTEKTDAPEAPGLVQQAQDAYGIANEHVLSAVERNGAVTLITVGGARLTWRPGDEPAAIPRVRITGRLSDA